MRMLNLLASGLLVLVSGSTLAHAEAKKKGTPTPPSETVRYFQVAEGFLGDLTAEGFIKEMRQGPRLTSVVMDVCHSVSAVSARKDRFVLTLRVEGTRLTGSGQSQEAKAPVAVNLVRKPVGKTVTFEGSVTLGGSKIDISSEENTDMSEQEYLESQASDAAIVAEPVDFVELSPGSIAVRAKREAVGALMKEIKGQNVEVVPESLGLGCDALRTGEQEVRMLVDPERAPELVKKVKGLPGVVDAGWFSGAYTIDRSIRVAVADWKGDNGAYDRPRIVRAVIGSIAKTLKATVESTNRDATTGEIKVILKRDSQSIAGLGLKDRIEAVLVVSAETLKANDGVIVWLRDISTQVVDDGPEPRLKFGSAGSDAPADVDEEELFDGLAKDLKGKRWDSEDGAWQ